MRRSPVTQQSTASNSSLPLSLSLSFALCDTGAAHLSSEQHLAAAPFLFLKLREGHWMYIVNTVSYMLQGDTEPTPPPLPQPPPWQSRDNRSPSAV